MTDVSEPLVPVVNREGVDKEHEEVEEEEEEETSAEERTRFVQGRFKDDYFTESAIVRGIKGLKPIRIRYPKEDRAVGFVDTVRRAIRERAKQGDLDAIKTRTIKVCVDSWLFYDMRIERQDAATLCIQIYTRARMPLLAHIVKAL